MPCQIPDCETNKPTVVYNGLNVCLDCVATLMKLNTNVRTFDNIIYSSKNKIVNDTPDESVCDNCSA